MLKIRIASANSIRFYTNKICIFLQHSHIIIVTACLLFYYAKNCYEVPLLTQNVFKNSVAAYWSPDWTLSLRFMASLAQAVPVPVMLQTQNHPSHHFLLCLPCHPSHPFHPSAQLMRILKSLYHLLIHMMTHWQTQIQIPNMKKIFII